MANGSSANIKVWEIQLFKIVQSGGFISPNNLFNAPFARLYLQSKTIAK